MTKQEIAEEIQNELKVFKDNAVNIETLLKSVKESLGKLSKVKDETVESVLGELSEYVEQLDQINKGEKVVEPVAEPLVQKTDKPKVEEPVENKEEPVEPAGEEVKTEPVAEPVEPKVEEPVEPKAEDLSADLPAETLSIELSQKVAGKLEESAIELSKLEGVVDAKTEIINGYKTKVLELEKQLNNYKAKEEEQIALRFKSKANKLIELYAKLGITKGYGEIELSFSENQVDKLISDLEVMQPSSAKPVVKRDTSTVELSKQSNAKKELSPDEKAKLLFNFS